jgi:hypothetical protein
MTRQLPIRPEGHKLEAISRVHVEEIFSRAGWICQRPQDDYGIDLECEVVTGEEVSGLKFSIQLKATKGLKTSGGEVVHRCQVSTAQYFLQRLEPVMYVVYDGRGEVAYWVWVQPYLEGLDETRPGWREQQTVQIRIPLGNRLGADSIPLIEEHVRAWREGRAVEVGREVPRKARRRSEVPAELAFDPAGEDEVLIVIARFYHSEGIPDTEAHWEICRAIREAKEDLGVFEPAGGGGADPAACGGPGWG